MMIHHSKYPLSILDFSFRLSASAYSSLPNRASFHCFPSISGTRRQSKYISHVLQLPLLVRLSLLVFLVFFVGILCNFATPLFSGMEIVILAYFAVGNFSTRRYLLVRNIISWRRSGSFLKVNMGSSVICCVVSDGCLIWFYCLYCGFGFVIIFIKNLWHFQSVRSF